MKIALAGNPNCGKTTLFNALTGSNQHVGNYAGVTVEKKEGFLRLGNEEFQLVDLPGIYSLTAYSEDELVARNFLLSEKPDLIINVIDSGNLERNLYLTIQLMEMGLPMIVTLNMKDEAERQGLRLDEKKLEVLLGVPVVSTVGHRKKGIEKLLELLSTFAKTYVCPQYQKISYGSDIDETINQVVKILEKEAQLTPYRPLWLALKLLEADEEVHSVLRKLISKEKYLEVKKEIQKTEQHIKATLNDIPENIIGDYRYGFASSLAKRCLSRIFPERKNISDKIDLVLTHKFMGPVLLLALLLPIYHMIFHISEYPTALLEKVFGSLKDYVNSIVPEGIWQSLLSSGIIDGVGGVLSFTPIIVLMFVVVAIIEDSGYMARIAFIMDRFLRAFGMHGSSILAYIVAGGMGGGCAVPGVLATRTLRDPKEKLATILTAPFMNCGAKLPVFALLISAFFPARQGLMMFVVTLLSWFFALFFAAILRATIIKGETTPFVMELPPYRWPTFKGLMIHTWERTVLYVKKAGTYILGAAIVIWALMSFPLLENNKDPKAQLEYSYAGRMGKTLEVVSKPLMGFTWETNIALVAGTAAKEVIISTLGIAHSLSSDSDAEKSLRSRLQNNPEWNSLIAFALMIFIMLYTPCIATLATIYKETQSLGWTLFSLGYSTTMAALFATLTYQLGSFLG